LLGDEGGGCLINVNDREYSVEFVAFDPVDFDRSAVTSVTLVMSMWRTIAEGVRGGGVSWAARYAIVRRAMVVDGIEAFGATMGMRGTCRLRVAEAGLGAGGVQRTSPPKRRKVESISARAGGARRWSSGRVQRWGLVSVMFVPVSSRCHSGRDEGFHVVQSRANGGVEHFEGGAKFVARSIVPVVLSTCMGLHLKGKARGSVLV
jgi:hypothetical protein